MDYDEVDYRNEIKVDMERLEENLISQPELVMKYGRLWAQKTKERDRAKENLSVIDSEQDTYARKNWEDISDVKLTEKSVMSHVLKTEEHKKAMNTLLDLTEEVNILSVAKSAFDHRKKSLEGLVSLFIAGYYADPKIAKGDFDEVQIDKSQKKISTELEKNPRLRKIKLKKK